MSKYTTNTFFSLTSASNSLASSTTHSIAFRRESYPHTLPMNSTQHPFHNTLTNRVLHRFQFFYFLANPFSPCPQLKISPKSHQISNKMLSRIKYYLTKSINRLPFSHNKKPLTPSQATGSLGESIAVQHLKSLNFRILQRNFRHKNDEIDIIALDKEILVFIEVKTRQEDRLVPGFYAAASSSKKKALRRAASAYLNALKYPPKHLRFDIIEVKLCQMGQNCVSYYKNVPLFHKYFKTS